MEERQTTLDPMEDQTRGESRPLPTLTVISHPNPMRMGEYVILNSLANGKMLELSRTATLFNQPGKAIGKSLDDPYISRNPIVFRPGRPGGVLVDCRATKTQVIAAGENLVEIRLFTDEELEKGVVLVLGKRVVLLLHWTHKEERRTAGDHGFVGASDGMVLLREEIGKVADLETAVLLRGESGTGKELAARAIHEAGRKGQPFVSVNMGAIPPSLAASELFGAVRGSFTGASRDQGGFFRAAQGGTLFLDEIGEASPEVQVMLLRALESGEISPVGAQQTIKITTRLIAATDADLESKMLDDSFKTPLFHRLAGYEIQLPPLRNRLEDFGRLFLHFAYKELVQMDELYKLEPAGPKIEPWLPYDLTLELLAYDWPGNIRQLRNTVRQLIIGCRYERVLWAIPKLKEVLSVKPPDPPAPIKRRMPKDIPDEELLETLQNHDWDIQSSATALKISRGALYKLIDKTPELRRSTDLGVDEIQACLQKHEGDLAAAAKALHVSPRALRRRITQLGR